MRAIEQALKAGAEWMESNKNHPDVEAFGCVAAAVPDLARAAYGDKKETAGDAAVTCAQFYANVLVGADLIIARAKEINPRSKELQSALDRIEGIRNSYLSFAQ